MTIEQKLEKIAKAIQAVVDAFSVIAGEILKAIKRMCNRLVLIALKTMGQKSRLMLGLKVYQTTLRRKFALRLFILRLEG